MTVLNKLNDVSIFIVPLLDDNLLYSDVSEESGFINAYTEDINRPSLQNKIFLMYDGSTNTKESLERYIKFEKLETIYSKKYITIKNVSYIIYCFIIENNKKAILEIINSGKTTNLQLRNEILQFWLSHENLELVRRLFVDNYRKGEPVKAVLPEEDYYSYEDFLK